MSRMLSMRGYISRVSMGLTGITGYLLLRILKSTMSIRWIHRERLKRLLSKKGQRVIYCFWHDRLLMMPFIALGQKVNILISQHRDGEYISSVIAWFGFRSIRGSSTRGGSLALRQMAREMRAGWHAAITPDGPKGPRHRAKDGAILLASITGFPLIPMAFGSSKKKPFPVGTVF